MAHAPELLFHHYDGSPFSEKIRLAFGRKGLRWRSVIQPNMMPKPQLVPLTGGYRRIPVLQLGAGAAVPKAFIDDRTALMGGSLDFGAFVARAPLARGALRAHLALLETQLADGRAYLLGAEPSFADFAAYHPVWFLRAVPPARVHLAEFPGIETWAERVASIGHGARTECSPEEALRIAREAKPAPALGSDARDPNGLAPGDPVRVVPDDYGFDPASARTCTSWRSAAPRPRWARSQPTSPAPDSA